MRKNIFVICGLVLLASCAQTPVYNSSEHEAELGSREIASANVNEFDYVLSGESKFNSGHNPRNKMGFGMEHFIQGTLQFDKTTAETRPILELEWWYGEDDGSKGGFDALCNGEEKFEMSSAGYLVKKHNWNSVDLAKLEQLTRDDLLKACEKAGGVPSKIKGELDYEVVASQKYTRVRGLGIGLKGLIPAPRTCYFYHAKMGCDLSEIKGPLLDLIRDSKAKVDKVIDYDKARNRDVSDWERYHKDLETLEGELD